MSSRPQRENPKAVWWRERRGKQLLWCMSARIFTFIHFFFRNEGQPQVVPSVPWSSGTFPSELNSSSRHRTPNPKAVCWRGGRGKQLWQRVSSPKTTFVDLFFSLDDLSLVHHWKSLLLAIVKQGNPKGKVIWSHRRPYPILWAAKTQKWKSAV